MKKKRKLGRKLLSFLLTLAMVVGLMPGMGVTALATVEKAYADYDVTTETNKTKNGDDLTALQVTFNGRQWYIIEDNSSSATSRTVTLLSADTSFGTKTFHESFSNIYSTSQVKAYLDSMTGTGGAFAGVADAIETVNLTINKYNSNEVFETVNGVKLYLLSTEEAGSLPVNVRKAEFTGGNCSDKQWWLRSPGGNDLLAAYVGGDGGVRYDAGAEEYAFGVRPALKLNLSKVTFDSGSNTFSVPTQYPLYVGGTQVTSANKNDIPATDGTKTGTASYNPETKVLTLTNYQYSGKGSNQQNGYNGIYIGADQDTLIHLNGTNIITISNLSSDTTKRGIYNYSGGDISIEGSSKSDKLTINNAEVSGAYTSCGVMNAATGKNISIENCTIEVNANVGTSTAAQYCYGIYATNDISIVSADVTAHGIGYGILCKNLGNIEIDNSSRVMVTGTTAAINAMVRTGAMSEGWENVNMTGSAVDVGTSSTYYKNIDSKFKAVRFTPVHTHNFAYSASGATITAICDDTSCELHNSPATLTLSAADASYSGSAYEGASFSDSIAWMNAGLTMPTIEYEGRGSTNYTESTTAPTNAGTYTASITVDTNKTATADFTITPIALTITGATATNRTYDKDSTAVTISAVTFKDSSQQAVALTVGEDKDYTVTGAMSDANAGDGKTVNVTVTLKNANYSLASNTTTATVNIYKAEAQTIADMTDTLLYTATSVSESVAGKMSDDAGTLTYSAGSASKTGSVTVSNFVVNATSGAVTATLSGGAAGDTVTLPVTIGSTNYADSTVNVKITLTAKSDAGVDITGVPASKTYGDADFTLIGSVTDEGTGTGNWTWSTSDETVFQITPNGATATVKILKAGSATVTAKYESDTTIDTETTATITVNTKTLTITAKDQSIYVGGTVPTLSGADFYTVTGLVGTDTLTTAPTLAYQKNGSAATPDNNVAGTYDIVASGATASDNYTITYANGTLTISEKQPATVTKVPTAKTLTYTGSAQALVTAGTATGGEMQYALGDANGATQPYTTSIPTKTDAGTYYVWYKAKGDANHNDSTATCIVVVIGEKVSVSYTVTFKVVNGAWNDGTTEDKNVVLSGYEGDTLKLTENQIPAVGSKPNDNYKAGNWDVVPTTSMVITTDKTFTYTYTQDKSGTQGTTNEEVIQEDNTPKASVSGLDNNLTNNIMTPQEKAMVNSGQNSILKLIMKNIDASVPQQDKNLTEEEIKKVSNNANVAMFLDLSLWLSIGQNYSRQIESTGEHKIGVELEVPEDKRAPAGMIRTFLVIQVHNNASNIIARTTAINIPLVISDFSTYALAYVDEPAEKVGFYSGLKITQKNDKIKISWDKTEGVAKYEAYVTYCGKKYPKKPTKSTTSNSVTIKKIKDKKIDFTKNFKLYEAAYDGNGNIIGKSVNAHFAGKDSKEYKNPKDIKLKTKSITIDKEQTSKIKASVKMEKGKGKELSDNHAPKFRYKTTNTNVATVDKKGKVTGVNSGTCTIYVYAKNGCAKKVAVTVN
ncbi:MBG domain-containing protein [Butyrivibrio sp. AC2005]|uniref:MBG domain-containing protein n=1 Tax=Butyrivibrio sp. AC2005 TaxID=1280672 RepID=UPI000406562B|nr:MBG domain-containing protein [Butyrivibrio sp. AC2005]